jgi:hypothetical protein
MFTAQWIPDTTGFLEAIGFLGKLGPSKRHRRQPQTASACPDCYHQGVIQQIKHQKWLGNAHLHGHFNGNIICKWEFSIAMFDYRRVSGKIAETHHAEPSSSAFGEIIDKSLT